MPQLFVPWLLRRAGNVMIAGSVMRVLRENTFPIEKNHRTVHLGTQKVAVAAHGLAAASAIVVRFSLDEVLRHDAELAWRPLARLLWLLS